MQEYLPSTKGPLVLSGYIDKDDVTPINVYWGAPIFVPSTIYKINDVVKPTIADGYYYKCIKTGLAGTVEPVWGKKVTSGIALFKAVSYDLFVKYNEVLVASTWEVTNGITISSMSMEDERTCVVITYIPDNATSFDLTNHVIKSDMSGSSLSRTFRFTVNAQ